MNVGHSVQGSQHEGFMINFRSKIVKEIGGNSNSIDNLT